MGVGIAALAAGSAFAGTQYADRVSITAQEPAPGVAVASKRPLVAFTPANAGEITKLKVLLDGKDVSGSVGRDDRGRVVLPTRGLDDGEHTVEVQVGTRNLFSRSVRGNWTFEVDTTQPALKLKSPKAAEVNTRTVDFAGTTEPGATIALTWKGGKATATAAAGGAWSTTAALPEGASDVSVQIADRAGNLTRQTRRLVVDTRAPKLLAAKVPAKITDTDVPVFTGSVRGERIGRVVLGATVNGRTVTPARLATPGTAGGPSLALSGNAYTMSVGSLPQGQNTVTVFARDAAGNTSERKYSVLVDSTEEFGGKDIIAGARGADVKTLQASLKSRGFKKTKITGVYDTQTATAVGKYQRVHKLKRTGLFRVTTREYFVGKIVVDISSRRLQLIRDGKVARTYRVAVGTSAYPTPTGKFNIVNKQVDPTWIPPNSPWAKGLGPIPPGPGNPLGTRWMGTSAPAVGIHGTYASSSIGTAASHGCIRMHIKEVEALYEEVSVGMPVELRA